MARSSLDQPSQPSSASLPPQTVPSPIHSSQPSSLPPDLESRPSPATYRSHSSSTKLDHTSSTDTAPCLHRDSHDHHARFQHDDDDAESQHHRNDHDHHDDATTATPPTPESGTEHEISLSDQTNFLPKQQVILCFIGLSAALFTALLDQSIISTALGRITESFHAGNQSSWLSTSYLLTSTAASPLYGRFSDIFGRKVCLLVALIGFLIGSALCAAAQSITQLIVFRALSGAFGGGIVSLVMVVIGDVVSLRQRGTYQGVVGVVVALANAGGPLIGGALASVGWRWCFIIAVPIILVALVMVVFLLPLKKVDGDIKSKLAKVDYLGILLVLAGTVLMLLGLNWGGQQYSWTSPRVLVTLILGAVLYITFAFVEARFAALPLVPMRLFQVSTVCSVLVQTVASGGIFYLLLFFVPQFAQVVKGYSGIKAGVTLIPLMAFQAISSIVAGVLTSKTGKYKLIIVSGFACYSIGVGLLSLLNRSSSIGEMIGFLLLSGFGAGGTFQTTLVAAQNAVDRKDLAVVTSARNFARLFGGTLGLAISYTILNNTVRHYVRSLPSDVIAQVVRNPEIITSGRFDAATSDLLLDAYVQAFRNVFRFGLGLTLLAFVVTVLFTKEFSLDRKDDEQRRQEGKQWYAEKKDRRHGKRHPDDQSALPSRRASADDEGQHEQSGQGDRDVEKALPPSDTAAPAATAPR